MEKSCQHVFFVSWKVNLIQLHHLQAHSERFWFTAGNLYIYFWILKSSNTLIVNWYWVIGSIGRCRWQEITAGMTRTEAQMDHFPLREQRSHDPEVNAVGLGFSSCHALMGLALCCYDYLSWMDLISIWWGLGLRVGWSGGSRCLSSRRVASLRGDWKTGSFCARVRLVDHGKCFCLCGAAVTWGPGEETLSTDLNRNTAGSSMSWVFLHWLCANNKRPRRGFILEKQWCIVGKFSADGRVAFHPWM